MSYCRFIEADAYIYDDISYGLYCCACSITLDSSGFKAGNNYDLMLEHIATHRSAGDYIPEYVDEGLIEERDAKNN